MMNNLPITGILALYFQKNASRFALEQVFLYGSRSQGLSRPDSDLDIAVVFSAEIEENVAFAKITEMSLELNHVVGLEVNVLQLTRDFRHPMLYYNAIVHGIPLFIVNQTEHIDLKLEALREMEDFSLFGIGWQLTAARKNLEAITHG